MNFVLLEEFLPLCYDLIGTLKQEVLYDVIDIEVEFWDGLFEGLLDVADIFLEEFGEDAEVFVPEADLIDAGEFLAEGSHQFVDVAEDVLVLVLANQGLLLIGPVQVVGAGTHLQETCHLIEQLHPVLMEVLPLCLHLIHTQG